MGIYCKKIDYKDNPMDEMYVATETTYEQELIQSKLSSPLENFTARIQLALKNIDNIPDEDVKVEVAELIAECQEEIVDVIEEYITNYENVIPAVKWNEKKNMLTCKFYYWSSDSYLN